MLMDSIQLPLDVVIIEFGENGIFKRTLAKMRSRDILEESSGKKWGKTGITIMILMIHTMINND